MKTLKTFCCPATYLLLFSLLHPVCCSDAANSPTLEAVVGLEGMVQEGASSPVQVRLRTASAPFEGELRLAHRKRGLPELVIVKPVALPHYAISDSTFQVVLGVPLLETLSLSLICQGKSILSRELNWQLDGSERKVFESPAIAFLNAEKKQFASDTPPLGSWRMDLFFVLCCVGCFALFVFARSFGWKRRFMQVLALAGVALILYASGIGRTTAKDSAFLQREFVSPSGVHALIHLIYIGSREPFEIPIPSGSLIWFPEPAEASRTLERVELFADDGVAVVTPRIAGTRTVLLSQRP